MKEIIFTSSALIAALLLLRVCFRGAISRRLQYALWLVVAVRLLLPVSLPGLTFSLLSGTQEVQSSLDESLTQREVYVLPMGRSPVADYPMADGVQPGQQVPTAASFGYPVLSQDGQTVTHYADRVPLSQILHWIWYGGMLLVGGCFLLTNFRFSRRLRKGRTLYSQTTSPLPVYLVENLPSPCLFGLFRPAVYLSPNLTEDETRLRHVLAHELSHYAHLDHFWSLLRCLCLTVHWFNPLVWLAAIVSKTDCELACDEAALARLGAEERLPYGQTLLSLIPIRKGPANPLLSATTMTAGKRQLTDRIRRIAENRKTVATALFLVLALVLLACAFTFTGAKSAGSALTSAQLRYFNETYFNDLHQPLRNQFLTSYYEKPEDIDLFQLLYNGIGPDAALSGEESAALAARDLPLIYDTAKITTADLNALLLEYTGLSLEQSQRVGLDQLPYFSQFDAYYQIRSDTNYPLDLEFTAGERNGDLLSLYYPNESIQGAWFCLTLRDLGQDQYHFVSHLPSDGPHFPPVQPKGQPDLVIPLSNVTPYTPSNDDFVSPVLDSVSATDESTFYYATFGETPEEQFSVAAYRLDGQFHIGYRLRPIINSDSRFVRLMTLTGKADVTSIAVKPFENLFGQQGFVLKYSGNIDFAKYDQEGPINEYIAFTEDGGVAHLLQLYGQGQILDLNGDGENELVSSTNLAQLFYRKNDQIYCVPIEETIQQAWPEVDYLSPGIWTDRTLSILGYVSDFYISADRTLTFTGDALELRRDNRTTVDHVTEGIDVPPDVLAAAKVYAQSQYEDFQESSYQNVQVNGQWETQEVSNAYDNWRIEYLSQANVYQDPFGYVQPQTYDDFYGLNLEIYRMNYEFHTPTPETAVLAGGSYVTEDGWHMAGYPNCTYLFFQIKDGQRVFLHAAMINDTSPGMELFDNDLKERLIQAGLITPATMSVTREGSTEAIPVREFGGPGFRILIPREGWSQDNIPTPPDNHGIHQWTSTVNDAVRLTIHGWQHKDPAFARDSVFLEHPGYVFEQTEAADREILYGYNQATGMTLALFITEDLYGSKGSTRAYSVVWQYPSEAEEGFGVLLRAMAESFRPDRPLTSAP